MKGSIRFNNDINVEVDVDPAAEEGARLSSAVNLVDGQELGVGGGSDLPVVTPVDEGKVLTVNDQGEWVAEDNSGALILSPTDIEFMSELNASYSDLLTMLNKGLIPHFTDFEGILWGDGNTRTYYLIGLSESDGAYYCNWAGLSYNMASVDKLESRPLASVNDPIRFYTD